MFSQRESTGNGGLTDLYHAVPGSIKMADTWNWNKWKDFVNPRKIELDAAEDAQVVHVMQKLRQLH